MRAEQLTRPWILLWSLQSRFLNQVLVGYHDGSNATCQYLAGVWQALRPVDDNSAADGGGRRCALVHCDEATAARGACPASTDLLGSVCGATARATDQPPTTLTVAAPAGTPFIGTTVTWSVGYQARSI